MRLAVISGLAVLLCTISHRVQAQEGTTTSIALEQYEPSVGAGVFGTYGAHTLEAWDVTAGVHVHYSDGALRLVNDRTQLATKLVSSRLATEVTSAVGLFDIADVGVGVRVVPYQQGAGLSAFNPELDTVSGAALGDLRIVGRLNVFGRGTDGLGLAVVTPITIPIGDESSFNSDGKPRLAALAAVDYTNEAGLFIGANVGYEIREERTMLNYVSDDVMRWSLGAAIPAPTLDGRLSLVTTAFGSVAVNNSSQSSPTEIMGGLQYRFGDNVHVTLAGGAGIGRAVGTPEYRFLTQFSWLPAPAQPTVPLVEVDTAEPEEAATIETVDEPVEVAAAPALGTITGLIRDADSGEPLADAEVTTAESSATTDMYGRFRIELPVGETALKILVAGYGPANQTVQVTADAEQDIEVGVRQALSTTRGTIEGDVRSRVGGQPLSATLMIQSSLGDTRVVRTDAVGKFQTELAVGQYTFSIQVSGYAEKVRTVVVRPGELTIYNFLLAPTR